jgi:hypothetical protein
LKFYNFKLGDSIDSTREIDGAKKTMITLLNKEKKRGNQKFFFKSQTKKKIAFFI